LDDGEPRAAVLSAVKHALRIAPRLFLANFN